jgi:hypothetical protein
VVNIMSENPKQLTAPSSASNQWLLQVLVLLASFTILLILLLSEGGGAAPASADLSVAEKPAEASAATAEDLVGGRIQFVQPQDGQEVGTTFTVVFQAVNLTVEPAGEIREGAGHFHVLIDVPFVAGGEVIPTDENHRHFGDGSLSTELSLEPGTYTLRLQFADGAHQAYAGAAYQDEITIMVVGE